MHNFPTIVSDVAAMALTIRRRTRMLIRTKLVPTTAAASISTTLVRERGGGGGGGGGRTTDNTNCRPPRSPTGPPAPRTPARANANAHFSHCSDLGMPL